MKIVKYAHLGRVQVGLLDGDGIVAWTSHDPAIADIADAVAPAAAASAQRMRGRAADVAVADVRLLPPLSSAARIFCVGLNYRSHVEETGNAYPPHPTLFSRTHESLVGDGQPLMRPRASTQFDYEGELVAVIGRAGRAVSEAEALSIVGGYTCCNEGSVRDFQKHSGTAFTGKNFDASGALGPWIVPATQIPDPGALTLTTRLNGEVVQHAGVDQLIYPIPRLIAYLSTCLRLLPGDLVVTGTPAGVGARRVPPRWLVAGDVVEIEISEIGTLRNTVADE